MQKGRLREFSTLNQSQMHTLQSGPKNFAEVIYGWSLVLRHLGPDLAAQLLPPRVDLGAEPTVV